MEENKLVIIEKGEIVIPEKTIEDYKKLAKLKLEFELMDKDFKAQLKEAMESVGKDSVIRDGFSAKIKKGYTTKRFDSARFKKECPEIYEEYSKDSSVSSSITIDVSLNLFLSLGLDLSTFKHFHVAFSNLYSFSNDFSICC